jgi:soluble lytic murein transglycosylase
MHGGDLYGLRLLILSIIIFSGSLMASTHYQFKDIDKIKTNKKIRLTKQEVRISKNFNSLFKLSKKGIYNSKLTKKLHKKLLKSKTFYKYNIWTKNLLAIQAKKSFTKLKDQCHKLSMQSSTDLVVNFLNQSSTNLCFNKYLKDITKRTHRKSSFHKKELAYFKEHTPYLLSRINRNGLEIFFNRFQQSNSNFKKYSMAVISYLIKSDTTPSKSLLKAISITPKLTRYLQSKDLHIYGTQKTFYREFRKLRKTALDFADKNPGSLEIKVHARAALNYFNATRTLQNKELIFKSLLSFGKSLTRRKEYDLARSCFKRLLQEDSKIKEKVIFEYLWTYTFQGDHDDGLEQVIAKYAPNLDTIKSNSKLHFWIGLSHDEEGNDEKAKEIFEDLIRTNPLSYYAILAAKKLSQDLDENTQDIYLRLVASTPQNKMNRNLASTTIDYHWLRRVIGWSIVNNDTFLNLEIKNTRTIRSGKDLHDHLLSAAYSLGTKKDYLESFKVIYRNVENKNININKDALKILFPQPYYSQIKKKTKNFDPIIALSLIRQESGFNAHARSHVGARGLMQLMPNTAKRFKRRVTKRQLYNAKLNIQIGTKYFNKLLTRYDQNLVYSLAAYNAGERRVDEWQEQYLTSDSILKNIENIPFLETRKYVKLIFRNIFFYKMLFNKNENDGNDSFNKIYDIKLGFNK